MTPSILLPCLGQTTKCTPSRFKTRAKAWGGAGGGGGMPPTQSFTSKSQNMHA